VDLVGSGRRQDDANTRQCLAVDRPCLFDRDASDRRALDDSRGNFLAGIGDGDVPEIDEYRQRIRPAHRVRDWLGRFDQNGRGPADCV